MLITTTPGIEGRPVTEYLGIVTAQGVLGTLAGLKDHKDLLPRLRQAVASGTGIDVPKLAQSCCASSGTAQAIFSAGGSGRSP